MCWISLRKWTDSNIGLDAPSVLQSTASCGTSVTQLTLWSIKLAFFHCEQIKKRKRKLACHVFLCVYFLRDHIPSSDLTGFRACALTVRASACSSCASKYGCLVTDSSLAFYRESGGSATKLCSLGRMPGSQYERLHPFSRRRQGLWVTCWMERWPERYTCVFHHACQHRLMDKTLNSSAVYCTQ